MLEMAKSSSATRDRDEDSELALFASSSLGLLWLQHQRVPRASEGVIPPWLQ